jgi:hypothetical protein
MLLALASVCPSATAERYPAATGHIRVSANGHWLEFRGKPVLLVGDSITQGWMELGTDFDQQAYLQALGRRGINAVLLWSYIGVTDQQADPRIGYDAPELWPWTNDHDRFDLQRFNDAYFDRLREFVRLANNRDIVVVITVHDGWPKTKFSGHPFNRIRGGPLADRRQYVELHDCEREMPQQPAGEWSRRQKHQYYLERFCDRLLQATADQPNVMYEMFNEGEWYDQQELRAFQVHFLEFFRARTALPLLVNDDHVGGRDFRGTPAADVISLHKPRWDDCPPARVFFAHYQLQFAGRPAKPIFFSEPVPEYHGDKARHPGIVRLLWGTLLGGAGVVLQNDASWGFASRAAMATHAANRDAVLDLEGHAARFFNDGRIGFSGMVPDGRLSSTGICLASAGEEYVIYAPGGERFTVDLSGANGRTLSARWYDPTTGKAVAGPAIAGGAAQPFQPPFAGDAILHLSTGSRQHEEHP